MRRPVIIVSLFLAVLALGACGPHTRLPDPKPLPAGQTFAGVWWSKQFEHMYLRQTGEEVHGIYTFKHGGTLDGKANGNLLKFTWIDPGDKSEARRSMKGKGWLELTKKGDKVVLKGQWGYNKHMSGGGPWTAEFVRAMDSDDPRSLEEWRENR